MGDTCTSWNFGASCIALLSAVSFTSSPAFADAEANASERYRSGHLNISVSGNGGNTETGFGVSWSVGAPFETRGYGWEASAFYDRYSASPPETLETSDLGARVDVLKYLKQGRFSLPYVSGGLGLVRTSGDPGSEINPMIKLGFGVMAPGSKRTRYTFRWEIQFRQILAGDSEIFLDDPQEIILSLGILLPN